MSEFTLPLPGLSPVADKSVVVKFDGGSLSSDGGVLALREVEQQLSVAGSLAAYIEGPRARSDHPYPVRTPSSSPRAVRPAFEVVAAMS